MNDSTLGYVEAKRNGKDPVYWKRGPIKIWNDKQGVTVKDQEGYTITNFPLPERAKLNWKEMDELVIEICNIKDASFSSGLECGKSEQQLTLARCLGLDSAWLTENT